VIPTMPVRTGNRAVSALFRVFGGMGRSNYGADAWEQAGVPGMHAGERLFLAVFVPFSLWGVIGAELYRWIGAAAWLLAFPIAFFGLNVLPFLFNVRSPLRQWRSFLGLFAVWAALHLYSQRSGWSQPLAYAWAFLAIANFLACLILLFARSLDWPGKKGIIWRLFLIMGSHVGAILLGWHWAWYWGVAAGVVITSFYCSMVLRPGCQWLGPVRCRSANREILITIDDGPDPHDTPVLLDLLDRYEKKAIFFLIGQKVRRYPDLAREILRRGHQIGNHTMTHPQASFWCATPWRTRKEIEECQRVITEVTGVAAKWFRAPVGHRNWFTHPITNALGLEIMGWNRRGFDAVEKNASKVLSKILPHLESGDIVLLHEGTPIAAEVLEGVLIKVEK